MSVVVNDHVGERLGHNSAGTRRRAKYLSCTVAEAGLGEPALVCGVEGLPGERERCRLPFLFYYMRPFVVVPSLSCRLIMQGRKGNDVQQDEDVI